MNSKLAGIIAAAFGLMKDQTDPIKLALLQKIASNNLGHKATPSHGYKLRDGYTHTIHEESKTRRKMAAKSRRINWHK